MAIDNRFTPLTVAPAYDSRGIPWASSPDNPNRATSTKTTSTNKAAQGYPSSTSDASSGAVGARAQATGTIAGVTEKTGEIYSKNGSGGKGGTGGKGSGGSGGGTGGSGGGGSGGGSGGSGGGGSGGGSGGNDHIASGTAPTAVDYKQAASATKRITQGVDMSKKIQAASEAWQDVNKQYADTTQPMIDNAGNDMGDAIDEYASESQTIIDQLKGISDDAIEAYARDTGDTIDNVKAQINEIIAGLEGIDDAEVGRVDNISTQEEEDLLRQITDLAGQQQMNKIDYTTNQGITELQRAEEDAAPQFQNMRNQIAANEQQALDNQALYAEMRGDRGGIGQAQYGAIQNTAATNQLTVNREQTKLATDTARQIADLRAQGEFKKADALLELTQNYLGQLMDLKKWGTEMNVSIDEFNINVDEWEEEFRLKAKELLADTKLSAAEYTANLDLGREKDIFNANLENAQQNAQLNLSRAESLNQQKQALTKYLTDLGIQNAQYMSENQINELVTTLNNYMKNAETMANTELSAANLTGVFSDKTPTAAMAQYTQQQLANAAQQLLDAGLDLTKDPIAALGMTEAQYKAKKGGSGGGSGNFADSWYAKNAAKYNSLSTADKLKAGVTNLASYLSGSHGKNSA